MNKNRRSPTGRKATSPALQNVLPNLLPHQKKALKQIKKSLMDDRVFVSVNFGRTV